MNCILIFCFLPIAGGYLVERYFAELKWVFWRQIGFNGIFIVFYLCNCILIFGVPKYKFCFHFLYSVHSWRIFGPKIFGRSRSELSEGNIRLCCFGIHLRRACDLWNQDIELLLRLHESDIGLLLILRNKQMKLFLRPCT